MGWIWLAKEVLPGKVYKDNNIQITAYQNKHGSWDYSYAYRVVTYKPDGTVTLVLTTTLLLLNSAIAQENRVF